MATTLLAGNALRTPVVPGAQLRTGDGTLYAGAVLRSPFVPGARLGVATDADAITAVLYDLGDLATPVTALDLSYDRSWQDVLSEAGAGSITLPRDDPALASFQDNGRDLVAMFYRGALAFLLVCSRRREVLIARGGGANQSVQYSGLGALGVLAKGTIGPTGGGGRSPIEEDRHYGWPASTFDHSGWSTVTVLGDIDHAIDVIAFELTADPADVRAAVATQLPYTTLIPVVGPPGTAMSTDAPVGDWYLYEDETTNPNLTIAEDGDYLFYVGPFDDEIEAYIDGQQVCSASGLNAFGVTSAAVTLSAGAHSVAIHVRNLDFTAGPNPTKVAWQITTEPTAASLVDPGGNSTLIAWGNGDAKVLAYPATPPGQTITKTIRLMFDECIARALPAFSDVDLDFTDTTYSDGAPAPAIPDIGTKVATDVYAFLQEAAGTYIDVRARVVGGRVALQVFAKGTMGGASGVTLDETNLLECTAESELHNSLKAWVRWDGGWTYLDTGTGDETVVEIGAPFSIEEIERMATAALAEVNEPKTQITAPMATTSAADAPYVAWGIGDTVTAPTGTERVVGVNMNEQGRVPVPTAFLRDVIRSAEARQAMEVAKL